MATILNPENLVNITEYPNTFKRQGAFPLERYSLFTSYTDADSYAKNNPIAYVGQTLVVCSPEQGWSFSDKVSHVITFTPTTGNNGTWKLDSDSTHTVAGTLLDTQVVFTYQNIIATRSIAASSKLYTIAVDSSLTEMGTAEDIKSGGSDAAAAIASAIAALDGSATVATNANGVVTINTTVNETDGVIGTNSSTQITLAKVATTGLADDVSYSLDQSNYISMAGSVKDALVTLDSKAYEIADSLSGFNVSMSSESSSTPGILKTYTFRQNNSVIGTVEIPKDLLVKAARIVQAGASADPSTNPPTVVVPGATSTDYGKKYIEFTINTADSGQEDQNIYIAASEFNTYDSAAEQGEPVEIIVNNTDDTIDAKLNQFDSKLATYTYSEWTYSSGSHNITWDSTNGKWKDGTVFATAGNYESALSVTFPSFTATRTVSKTVKAALDTINGSATTAGSIAKSLADAKSYTDTQINNLDTSADVPIASVSNSIVTIKAGIKEVNGIIDQGTGTDITLAKVAKTGAASDVAVVADQTSGLTAGTVQSKLEELKSSITSKNVSAEGDSYVGASASNNKVTVYTTIADTASSFSTTASPALGTAKGVALFVKSEIEKLDSTGTADSTGLSPDTTAISSVAVIDQVVETDGKISSVRTKLADSAGSATKALNDAKSYTDTKIAALDSTITKDAEYGGPTTPLYDYGVDNVVPVVAGVTIVETDGKLNDSQSIIGAVDVLGAGAAIEIESHLIGASTDLPTDDSIYGAKAYADTKSNAKSQYYGTVTTFNTQTVNITTPSEGTITPNLGDVVTYSGVEYILVAKAETITEKWRKLNGVQSVSFAGTSLTVGNNGALSITKANALSALNVADGAQVNVIETVKVGGNALTVTSKAVDINNIIIDGGSASQTIS